MNAKHTTREQPPYEPVPADGPAALFESDSDEVLLCALLDGELSEAELSDWFSRNLDMGEAAMQEQTHQLIGNVLRGQAALAGSMSASVFLAGVQTRLRSEAPLNVAPTESVLPAPAIEAARVRAPAANDAVFRWKLVAGLASLAAVMAVSWSVLETTPTGAESGPAMPQLALSQPSLEDVGGAAVRSVAAAAPAAAQLTVNTRQGVLIRDAELEALMAEHRQHGGVSALQMPAGFLRNATFDANAR
jgi:sigma-E factor negative regulatory protein RseA